MNNIFLQNTRVLEIIESENWYLEKFVTSAKQNIRKKGRWNFDDLDSFSKLQIFKDVLQMEKNTSIEKLMEISRFESYIFKAMEWKLQLKSFFFFLTQWKPGKEIRYLEGNIS